MKIKDGFVLEEIDGSYVAVAVGKRAKEFRGFITVNEVGAEIWRAMSDRDVTVEEIEEIILEIFDVEREDAHRDIVAFTDKLIASGIAQ